MATRRANGAGLDNEKGRGPANLDRLTNLLSLILVKDKKQSEQIDLLSRAGYLPAEIANLLGTTRNTVSVTLSNARSAKKARNI